MPKKWRAVTAAVSLWLAVVASTSTVAWLVINRAGREVVATDVAAPANPSPSSTPVADVSGLVTPTPTPTPRTTSATRPQTPASPRAVPSTSARPSPAPGPPDPRATQPPASPNPSPQASPPPPAAVTGSHTYAQGTVGVTCRGSEIALRSVRPEDGWAFEIDRSPTRITVTFREHEGDKEYTANALCQNGSPAFGGGTSQDGDGDGGSGGEG